MHDKDKSNTETKPKNEEYHNLVPEMERVGIQIWQVTYGALHNGLSTERIGKDVGLAEMVIYSKVMMLD